MVELPSCASLVSASTFRAIEHEGKGETAVNAIAEISAELQRERQRNAELMERISVLEAQIRERDEEHSLLAGGQGSCQNTGNRKPKRQKVTTNLRKKEKKERQKVTTNVPKKEEEEERQKVTTNVRKEEEEERQKVATNVRKIEDEDIKTDLEMKHNNSYAPLKDMNVENRLVNWMNTDDTESLSSEMLKESDSAADCKDTDESDDEDEEEDGENDICTNHEGGENCMDVFRAKSVKEQSSKRDMITEEAADAQCLVSSTSGHDEPKDITVNRECNGYLVEKDSNLSIDPVHNTGKYIKHHGKAINVTEGYQEASKTCIPGQEIKRDGDISLHKRHPKIAFCPKEVKRIIESEELSLKNAQSHTIRKIIVFASLGIRHGCEDMYELDFNHFAILRKGEPYVSSKDPGEHVLYENPGVRRKIFYPNLQNPTLCPVQILEEEKAMRPSDASCPSFLFLCIKYGGRTRNIPQNEYVRQRMGRNKLKSFGPAICRMAMLVHTRSGSFFFKALGITLLCMAGFANELVQRETKYRNLDLLYRIDEDAEGEELFLSRSATNDTGVRPISPQLMGKKMLAKFKSRKATKVVRKDQEKAMFLQSAPSNSGPPSKFKLLRTVSIQTQAITPVQYITSQAQADFSVPNPLISSISSNVPNSNQLSSYSIIPTHPASPFFPIIYWPPSNAFFPCPHPSLQSYRYPLAGNYISSYPQPNHGNPVSSTIAPKSLKESWKDDAAASEAGNDSKSSSSSTEPTKVENQTN